MTPKTAVLLAALAATLLLDQPAKFWVEQNLEFGERRSLVGDVVSIAHARNAGAAFGLLGDSPEGPRRIMFLLVSLLATGLILSFFSRLAPGDRRNALFLGLVLGGTLANLFDRLAPFRGEVVDFLHVRVWSGYTWPDFNPADVAIIIGVGGLILELLATEGAARARVDASS